MRINLNIVRKGLFWILTTIIIFSIDLSTEYFPVLGSGYFSLINTIILLVLYLVLYNNRFILYLSKDIKGLLLFCSSGFVFVYSSLIEANVDGTFTSISLLTIHVSAMVIWLIMTQVAKRNIQEYFLLVSSCFIVAGITHSLIALIAYSGIFFQNFHIEGYYRLTGLAGNPNMLARAISPSVILSLVSFLLVKNKIKSLLFIVTFILLIMTVILTFSRGYASSLIASCLAIVNYNALINQKISIIRLIFIISVVTILTFSLISYLDNWFFIQTNLSEQLNERFSNLESRGRFQLWDKFIDFHLQSPLINQMIGYGNGFLSRNFYNTAHNNYIRIIIEYGWIGLLIITSSISLLLRTLNKGYKGNYKIIHLVSVGIFTYVGLASFFNDFIGKNASYFFLIFLFTMDNFKYKQ